MRSLSTHESSHSFLSWGLFGARVSVEVGLYATSNVVLASVVLRAPSLPNAESWNMLRRLRKVTCGEIFCSIGRINGRHAPTIPSDDSIIGQYKVGVSMSIRLWLAQGSGHPRLRRKFIQLRSKSLERTSTIESVISSRLCYCSILTDSNLMKYHHFRNARSYNSNLLSIQDAMRQWRWT